MGYSEIGAMLKKEYAEGGKVREAFSHVNRNWKTLEAPMPPSNGYSSIEKENKNEED